MIAAFVLWMLLSLLMAGIGLWALRSGTPVGFFAGVKSPKVKDAKKYNRAVARLWFIAAGVFALLGVPLLFARQNSLLVLPLVFGTVIWAIGLMIAYTRIENRHRA